MSDYEQEVLSELRKMNEILYKILDAFTQHTEDTNRLIAAVDDVNSSVVEVDNTIGGWTAFPYLEMIREMPSDSD